MAVARPVSLNEADRAKVRHHLGYPNVEPVSSISQGFPSASQPQFLVEIAMDRIIPEGVGLIQKYLAILDALESQMVESFCRDKVQQIDGVKLRNSNEEDTEHQLLERHYRYWAAVLASDLGAPLNPFSERFRMISGGSINIPVSMP